MWECIWSSQSYEVGGGGVSTFKMRKWSFERKGACPWLHRSEGTAFRFQPGSLKLQSLLLPLFFSECYCRSKIEVLNCPEILTKFQRNGLGTNKDSDISHKESFQMHQGYHLNTYYPDKMIPVLDYQGGERGIEWPSRPVEQFHKKPSLNGIKMYF